MDTLRELGKWYEAQCDGNWEHDYGIQVTTLDNPGWSVKVDLRDTLLEHVPFHRVQTGETDGPADESWLVCEKNGPQFHGRGDPSRLQEILDRFLQWAREQPDWLAVPDEAGLRARDDDELWGLLGRDLVQEPCRVEGCSAFRVRDSVFCRSHHWTNVLGRPLPARMDDQ